MAARPPRRTVDSDDTPTDLAARVRAALALHPSVEEKRMFGGTMFMVNDAMCVSAGKDRLMCRVDSAIHDSLLGPGVTTVKMGGKMYRGYVHVSADVVRTKKAFDKWIALALEHNATLTPPARKKRKTKKRP